MCQWCQYETKVFFKSLSHTLSSYLYSHLCTHTCHPDNPTERGKGFHVSFHCVRLGISRRLLVHTHTHTPKWTQRNPWPFSISLKQHIYQLSFTLVGETPPYTIVPKYFLTLDQREAKYSCVLKYRSQSFYLLQCEKWQYCLREQSSALRCTLYSCTHLDNVEVSFHPLKHALRTPSRTFYFKLTLNYLNDSLYVDRIVKYLCIKFACTFSNMIEWFRNILQELEEYVSKQEDKVLIMK